MQPVHLFTVVGVGGPLRKRPGLDAHEPSVERRGYEPIVYAFAGTEGEELYFTDLFPVAVVEHLLSRHGADAPFHVHLGATDTAWKATGEAVCEAIRDRLGPNHRVERLPLPDVHDARSGTWSIYERFLAPVRAACEQADGDPENPPLLYFDATHGYRTMPLVMLFAAAFAQLGRGRRPAGVFYGNLEAARRRVEGPVPGLHDLIPPHRALPGEWFQARKGVCAPAEDLVALVDVVSWLSAAREFRRTGFADELGALLEGEQGEGSPLGNLGRALRNVSTQLEGNRVGLVGASSRELAQAWRRTNRSYDSSASPAAVAMKDVVRSAQADLADLGQDDVVARTKALIDRNRRFRHYAQAIALAREGLLTALAVGGGLPPDKVDDRGPREAIAHLLNNAAGKARDKPEWPARDVPSLAPFVASWDTVAGLRNDLMHCGYSPRDSPTAHDELEAALDQALETVSDILGDPDAHRAAAADLARVKGKPRPWEETARAPS